jgi:membrane-bound lytic murein transglycosylase B
MTPHLPFRAFLVGAVLAVSAVPAFAATCGTGSFASWLDDFKADAAAKGISQAAIASGLNGVTPDQAVLSRDRSQKVFSQSFEEFSGRMVPPRLTRGANMMKQYGSVLGRIEESYGVPGEVLVAIWGLETDFGVNTGKFPTVRSLVTLAYDCRRAETFRGELMDALRIIERGDLAPSEMRGAWAGEIGQTQFMPSISTATAAAICCTARPTCSHRPRTISPATAGSAARTGSPAAQISMCCSNGTRARSTRRRSPISRASSRMHPDSFGI